MGGCPLLGVCKGRPQSATGGGGRRRHCIVPRSGDGERGRRLSFSDVPVAGQDLGRLPLPSSGPCSLGGGTASARGQSWRLLSRKCRPHELCDARALGRTHSRRVSGQPGRQGLAWGRRRNGAGKVVGLSGPWEQSEGLGQRLPGREGELERLEPPVASQQVGERVCGPVLALKDPVGSQSLCVHWAAEGVRGS